MQKRIWYQEGKCGLCNAPLADKGSMFCRKCVASAKAGIEAEKIRLAKNGKIIESQKSYQPKHPRTPQRTYYVNAGVRSNKIQHCEFCDAPIHPGYQRLARNSGIATGYACMECAKSCRDRTVYIYETGNFENRSKDRKLLYHYDKKTDTVWDIAAENLDR